MTCQRLKFITHTHDWFIPRAGLQTPKFHFKAKLLVQPPGTEFLEESAEDRVQRSSNSHSLQTSHLWFLFLFKKIFIGVKLIYNVVLVSGIQHSESVIHIHISILFKVIFPYRSLQSTEYSSLCYTVGPYKLSILYRVACICQSQSPNLSLPPPSPGNHKFVVYSHDSTSVL